MKRSVLAGAGLALGLAAGVAWAQYASVPQVTSVGPTDLFADVVAGRPTPGTVYATAAQIAGVPGYTYVVPVTGFSATAGNSTALYYMNPAGTLATGTLTFAPNPGDGQRFCVMSTQTQTALTPTANTGQTIDTTGSPGAVTALTAGVQVCWVYRAANLTWYRTL